MQIRPGYPINKVILSTPAHIMVPNVRRDGVYAVNGVVPVNRLGFLLTPVRVVERQWSVAALQIFRVERSVSVKMAGRDEEVSRIEPRVAVSKGVVGLVHLESTEDKPKTGRILRPNIL